MFRTHQKSSILRTRVKICGITRQQDYLLAILFGVDAIGLVFYEKSPRAVSIKQAQAIVQVLPPFMTVVGLFVNANPSFVYDVLAQVPLDLLQFHGEESHEDCACFGKAYIKAVRMRPGIDVEAFSQRYIEAKALLLDTYISGIKGGTGKVFNWQQVPLSLSKPIIIAGGLTPDNVDQVITAIHPYAVDVSGGVESAKGIKMRIKWPHL